MKINIKNFGITQKTRLVVGISGGADSASLLHLLKKTEFKHLFAAHLDHGIRKESKDDALFVKKLCKQWKIPCVIKRKNVLLLARRRKENLEAVAREQRYAFLQFVRKKYKADFIVTAHHSSDQIETILMNMIRGCGLDGLCGMKTFEGDVFRPLLTVSKREILQYCRDHDLPFIHDRSNDNPRYVRNFLRHEVIPLLAKLNPNILETFSNNIRLWALAASFLESKAKAFLEEHRSSPRSYALNPFLQLSIAERQAVLRVLFQNLHGHKKNLSSAHLEQVLQLLLQKHSGKRKEFGSGAFVVKKKSSFEIV